MSTSEYNERDIGNVLPIQDYITSIEGQETELVLTSKGRIVGAILTMEQYNWFLDKLDESQDLGFIAERAEDKEGAQSLVDFRKELANDYR
ncbi:MAG: hypothetical protein LGR52_14525 [Candidatus Thiosymbion ectosymbiont of Robbea hypermnestra]|nr:hypothetical protein [Candidatus Thiosymbion ectosymbiont of Robbea hypermnestra]